MLIKIIDNVELESWLDELKEYTQANTASKAVAIAASNFIDDKKKIAELEDRLQQMTWNYENIKNSIIRYKEAKEELFDFEAYEH